jgi:AraC-like DNA-binding protein
MEMHEHAHGEVPHQIIEVDARVVESFLGRIEDPEKAQNTRLNIINDPAFRTIMVVAIEHHSFRDADPSASISMVRRIYKEISETLSDFGGNIVQQNEETLLISFSSVSKAVLCSLKIHEIYKTSRTRYPLNFTELSIGLHAGVPVTGTKSIFEDTIKLARRMAYISMSEIVVSGEVQQLFESENPGEVVNPDQIHTLTPAEEKFMNNFMEFIEKEWLNPGLKVEDIEKNMGTSKSKLYREMIRLTGKSPNVFLLHYRLRKSLQLLQRQKGNISEVAFDSGFNSPSYYARCFRKKYGIMPSGLI